MNRKSLKESMIIPEYQTDDFVVKVNSKETPYVKKQIQKIVSQEKERNGEVTIKSNCSRFSDSLTPISFYGNESITNNLSSRLIENSNKKNEKIRLKKSKKRY